MRLWYFFISLAIFLISGFLLFASFSMWESGRNDPTYPRKPKLVALCAGLGVAGLGLCVYLLSI